MLKKWNYLSKYSYTKEVFEHCYVLGQSDLLVQKKQKL